MTSQLNRNLEKTEAKEPTLFDRIFRDSEGNIVIAQPPNLPFSIGLAASFLHFMLSDGKIHTAIDLIAFGTLFVWAWQELFEGVNYFRRSVGLIGLVGLITIGLNLRGM